MSRAGWQNNRGGEKDSGKIWNVTILLAFSTGRQRLQAAVFHPSTISGYSFPSYGQFATHTAHPEIIWGGGPAANACGRPIFVSFLIRTFFIYSSEYLGLYMTPPDIIPPSSGIQIRGYRNRPRGQKHRPKSLCKMTNKKFLTSRSACAILSTDSKREGDRTTRVSANKTLCKMTNKKFLTSSQKVL